MGSYVIIESRDPFANRGVGDSTRLTVALARRGHEVRVFLVQNAVLAARSNGVAPDFYDPAVVSLWVDRVSAAERDLEEDHLRDGFRMAEMDQLVSWLMQEATKVLWL